MHLIAPRPNKEGHSLWGGSPRHIHGLVQWVPIKSVELGVWDQNPSPNQHVRHPFSRLLAVTHCNLDENGPKNWVQSQKRLLRSKRTPPGGTHSTARCRSSNFPRFGSTNHPGPGRETKANTWRTKGHPLREERVHERTKTKPPLGEWRAKRLFFVFFRRWKTGTPENLTVLICSNLGAKTFSLKLSLIQRR